MISILFSQGVVRIAEDALREHVKKIAMDGEKKRKLTRINLSKEDRGKRKSVILIFQNVWGLAWYSHAVAMQLYRCTHCLQCASMGIEFTSIQIG